MAKEKIQYHEAFRPCRDYLVALVVLLALASYLYGARVPIMAGVAVLTSYVCDKLVSLVRLRRFRRSDISSYAFALMFVVMLPASSRYSVVIVGTIVTVLLGKHAFGGYGCYPFHPSAFGFAFTAACYPLEVFSYPKPFSEIGIGFDSGAAGYDGISNIIKFGGVPDVQSVDLLIGNYQGPLGATFCLVLLACLLLLIAHGTISWQVPLAYLASCCVWAAAFPRLEVSREMSVVYEMLSGAVVFAAVFIVAEPTIVPKRPTAKLLFGVLAGVATMFFRSVGVFEMGVCFAMLLVEPIAPYLDRLVTRKRQRMETEAQSDEV